MWQQNKSEASLVSSQRIRLSKSQMDGYSSVVDSGSSAQLGRLLCFDGNCVSVFFLQHILSGKFSGLNESLGASLYKAVCCCVL